MPTQHIDGRYELLALIAHGGWSAVHRAFDTFHHREVALKRLIVSREAPLRRFERFFRGEYTTLARLAHPNIVEVYDYGVDAAGPYFTMELLPEENLLRLAPMPVLDSCRMLHEVAASLSYLHDHRLLHRDLNPSNVLVTVSGRPKLIDFGAVTSFGVSEDIMGAPAFIAPECLAKAHLDQRTDLYCLGALAYWLLTRRWAIDAVQLEDLLQAWTQG